MIEPLDIKYRDFYDFPRMFVVGFGDGSLLFDGSFQEEIDDYPDVYDVYVLPHLEESEFEGSWVSLSLKASLHLGQVQVDKIEFDPSRKRFVDASSIRRSLPLSRPLAGV